MLISYLLNKNIKTDIAYLANTYEYEIEFYEKYEYIISNSYDTGDADNITHC